MTAKTKLEQALAALSQTDDMLKAAIASALIPAASDPNGLNASLQKEIKERLFALISRQTASRKDPVAVVEALVRIDEYLVENAGIKGPFACRFAPTAAALVSHVESTALDERIEIQSATAAPIFTIEKRTLCAVLAAPLKRTGAAIFIDRILREVLQQKPLRVLVIIRMESSAVKEISDLLSALRLDLEEQCIVLEVNQEWLDSA